MDPLKTSFQRRWCSCQSRTALPSVSASPPRANDSFRPPALPAASWPAWVWSCSGLVLRWWPPCVWNTLRNPHAVWPLGPPTLPSPCSVCWGVPALLRDSFLRSLTSPGWAQVVHSSTKLHAWPWPSPPVWNMPATLFRRSWCRIYSCPRSGQSWRTVWGLFFLP